MTQRSHDLRHLDLFAGIGGFSRAVEWLGGETVAFVEWEAWNRRVLAKHWPEARFYGDITTVTDDDLRSLGRIDLITGGYPCQPFSLAGQRRGAEDDRHLWPEMRRVIDATRPRFVLAENVAGHISMGLDTVLADLEADGYTAGAVVVPAGAVNALHRRDRVWIMAHTGRGDDEWLTDIAGGHDANGTDSGRPEGSGRAYERSQDAINPDAHGQREPQPGGTLEQERRWVGNVRESVADPERGPGELRHESPEIGRRQSDTEQARVGGGVVWHRGGWRRRQDVPERSRDYTPIKGPGEDVADTAIILERSTDDQADTVAGSREAWAEPLGRGDARRGDTGTAGEGQAPRPVDVGAHGLRPGPLRRPAARSPWNDPDLIRAMWADGSWEADLPRVVTDEPERRQKLMAAGNAIVPLVAYEILRVMLQEIA